MPEVKQLCLNFNNSQNDPILPIPPQQNQQQTNPIQLNPTSHQPNHTSNPNVGPTTQNQNADYLTNSKSVYFDELRTLLLDPEFTRESQKSVGFAPTSFFKMEESSKLDNWMVPGLFCDLGVNIPLAEARKMLASDRAENSLNLPATDFTVLEVNRYMINKYSPAPHSHSPALMGMKMNPTLGPIYDMYSWVDPSAAILTEEELVQLLTDQDAMFMYPNLAPWPVTMFPRDVHDVKYLSVFRNNQEYVCRTKADRQRGVEFFTESSEIFNCIICKDIISTSFHTYVNCFIYNESASFNQILQYRKTFLRACYLHFKLEGRSMPGRNPYRYSQVETSSQTRGRGGSINRGRGRGKSSFRMGTPVSVDKLFD